MAIQSSAYRPLDFTLFAFRSLPLLRSLFGLDLPPDRETLREEFQTSGDL